MEGAEATRPSLLEPSSAQFGGVERWFMCWSILVCLSVVSGIVLSLANLGTTGDLIVETLRRGCRQIGIIGLALTAGALVVGRLRRWTKLEETVRRVNVVWVKLLIAAGVALMIAELFLRVVFIRGETFSWSHGPIVKQFERFYHLNRFGSRGRTHPVPWR